MTQRHSQCSLVEQESETLVFAVAFFHLPHHQTRDWASYGLQNQLNCTPLHERR